MSPAPEAELMDISHFKKGGPKQSDILSVTPPLNVL